MNAAPTAAAVRSTARTVTRTVNRWGIRATARDLAYYYDAPFALCLRAIKLGVAARCIALATSTDSREEACRAFVSAANTLTRR